MAISDNREDIPQKEAARIDVFAWLRAPLAIFGLLLLSLFFSILIEGVWFVWKNQDASHSQRMLKRELGYLSKDFRRRVFISSPAESTIALTNKVQKAIILDSGMLALHKELMRPVYADESTLYSWSKYFWQASSNYLFAATNIVLLFFVRLVVTVWSLGLFALATVLAFIDGLVERDLRTFGGDREHPMIQRWINPYVKPAFITTVFIYLAIPVSIHPNWVFVPAALLGGFLRYISTSNYMQKL